MCPKVSSSIVLIPLFSKWHLHHHMHCSVPQGIMSTSSQRVSNITTSPTTYSFHHPFSPLLLSPRSAQDFNIEEVSPEDVSPQMNQAVYTLRRACLPSQDHLSHAQKKTAGEKFVSVLKIDFEIMSPIDAEKYEMEVLEAARMKR
jgi:hypothetical protein